MTITRLRHWRRVAQREARDRLLRAGSTPKQVREDVAATYIRGSGIEVGALNFPLRVPRSATVRYVDYLPSEILRQHHAHLLAAGQPLTFPDVVDDGERLAAFADGELDFVIANHFIEHTEDPIATLSHHVRVLAPQGIVYMAIPDKRRCFDRHRPVTDLPHLIVDHEQGPESSRASHYLEWTRLVDMVPEDRVAEHAAALAERRFSIHFHVWTPSAFLAFLLYARSSGLPVEIELMLQNSDEFIVVLRKVTDGVSHVSPLPRAPAP